MASCFVDPLSFTRTGYLENVLLFRAFFGWQLLNGVSVSSGVGHGQVRMNLASSWKTAVCWLWGPGLCEPQFLHLWNGGNSLVSGGTESYNSGHRLIVQQMLFFYFICLIVSLLFRAALMACRSSLFRGQIRAIAAGPSHRHSNVGSEPPLWPTLQLTVTLDP